MKAEKGGTEQTKKTKKKDGNKIGKQKRISKMNMCMTVIYRCFSMLTFGVSNRAVWSRVTKDYSLQSPL